MTELLPCPFCGGEAELHYDANGSKWVACENRECAIQPYLYRTKRTEAEAIAAWNTRYHSVFEETVIKAWKEIKAYQERTCKVKELDALTQTLSMANCCAWGECSACGCLTPDDSKYCVECGAKVIA